MKRYLITPAVLAVLLLAAFTGGALAQQKGLSLKTLAGALVALAA